MTGCTLGEQQERRKHLSRTPKALAAWKLRCWPHQRTALAPEPDGQGQRTWSQTPRTWPDLGGSFSTGHAGCPSTRRTGLARRMRQQHWPCLAGEWSRGGGWTLKLKTSSPIFTPLSHTVLHSGHPSLGASTTACCGKYEIMRLNRGGGSRNVHEAFPGDLKEPAVWCFIGS